MGFISDASMVDNTLNFLAIPKAENRPDASP